MRLIRNIYKKTLKYLNNHTFVYALAVSILFIILTVGFGWYNNKVVTLTNNPVARYTLEPNNPLSFMANWDGPSYISIAKHGYQNVSQANYFPLYPILIHLLNKVVSSTLDSALIISWLCLIGAVYYYTSILKHLYKIKDNISSIKGLTFFILFPTSVFLVATYTESLLAFLSLAAIYYALKRDYVMPAMLMLLVCATHLDGIFVLLLVCLVMLEQKLDIKKIILTFVAGILGFDFFALYLQEKFNSPLSFIVSQEDHGWLHHGFSALFSTIDFFNIVFIILLIVSAIYWWNKRRSFSIYSLLFLLIPLVGRQFGGFNRYMIVAFPVQIMAYACLKDKHLSYSLLLALMGIIWAYFTLQYAGGYIGG